MGESETDGLLLGGEERHDGGEADGGDGKEVDRNKNKDRREAKRGQKIKVIMKKKCGGR